MKTLVFQSASDRQKASWLSTCLHSVRTWADDGGCEYKFVGEEIFEILPQGLQEKFSEQPVVRSDLARLIMTRDNLCDGYDRVIWADADFLIFDSDGLVIPQCASFSFGREVWVQASPGGGLRASARLHNAFFVFERSNPFLDFYIHAATRLLERTEAPVVPQFIGPKFLALQNNLIGFDEIPGAAMFSPLVLRDILSGGGPALKLLVEKQGCLPGGANLSLSHVGREVDGVMISEADAKKVVALLMESGLPH